VLSILQSRVRSIFTLKSLYEQKQSEHELELLVYVRLTILFYFYTCNLSA